MLQAFRQRANADEKEVNPPSIVETVDFYRADVVLKLNTDRRSELGQFMTPSPIARFMASLFSDLAGNPRVLDPGAGVGSLTAAVAERMCRSNSQTRSVCFYAYEIDPLLVEYLQRTLNGVSAQCHLEGLNADTLIRKKDFLLSFPLCSEHEQDNLTHVIMNPPYRKIHSDSPIRIAMRQVGIETTNLYTAFMSIAVQKLAEGGEMVAIIPRSFCNGPYFKTFRNSFFSVMTLQHIHLFEKRDCAFKEDQVLQENIIIHAIKGKPPGMVKITSSTGGDFAMYPGGRECIGESMTQHMVDYAKVIDPRDPDRFVHIASTRHEQRIADRIKLFKTRLEDLGIKVSTGAVVDFRLKDDLCYEPEADTAPLLYSAHFQNKTLTWPKAMKKPNAIRVSEQSRKWLWENSGYFVVTRRFTAKEERRRIVASVYASDLPGTLIGFDNHLNVFHNGRRGMSGYLAKGLNVFLNSSLVDRYFRQFNGHTQVNATDLRSIRYPHKQALESIGRVVSNKELSQQEIDTIIENEIADMTDDDNPILAQQKIDDALEILKAFGMPRGQQNERSALTLLTLIDMKPDGRWNKLNQPLMGVTPIMQYIQKVYGKEYAPNTRETIRRQTLHQFVAAGIAVYNPDQPDRPVNSPKACYQISDEAWQVMRVYGTKTWTTAVEDFLNVQGSLAMKWSMPREMRKIPVHIADGLEIELTPGEHSELISKIITEFAPRYAPASDVIYVGDTGSKYGHFQQERLATLGVTVEQHGKLPDVVLYFGLKDWLLLVEAVTSHGPVDALRHNDLRTLFTGATPGLVYITAFPDRSVMGRYLKDIAWETEVWCADTPTHLIHFDGKRFLGPYTSDQS